MTTIKTEDELIEEYRKVGEKIDGYLYRYGDSDSEIEQAKFKYKNEIDTLWKKSDELWNEILKIRNNKQYSNLIIDIIIYYNWYWDKIKIGTVIQENNWNIFFQYNKEFLDKPLDYQKTNDPYKDSGIKGEVSIETVQNNFQNQPRFKFGGGWFTCISTPLLKRIGVPQSFGHYGYEDTFVMWASEKVIKTKGIDIQQFKLKNVVVCEN